MATLTPNDAFTYAKYYVKGAPIDNVKREILLDASSRFWNAGAWRWTLGLITAPTVGNVQDVNFTTPADFLRFHRVWLERTSGAGDLEIVSTIPVTTLEGLPRFAAYVRVDGITDKVRFDVKYPASTETAPSVRLVYKKAAPLITTGDYASSTILGFEDTYFFVYREVVLYAAYKFADDPRAGAVTVSMNKDGLVQRQYTGQLAVVQSFFEDLKLSDPVMWDFPENATNRKEM